MVLAAAVAIAACFAAVAAAAAFCAAAICVGVCVAIYLFNVYNQVGLVGHSIRAGNPDCWGTFNSAVL